MSPTTSIETGKVSTKGKRLPGKPSRFDPDQPLHMTTRRAAKNRPSDGNTPSVSGSTEDDDSRRGSLEDYRPTTSHSNNSQLSATKAVQLPGILNFTSIINGRANGLEPVDDTITNAFSAQPVAPVTPIESTPSPTRKRKRHSQSSPESPALRIPSVAINYVEDDPRVDDEGDLAEVIDPSQLSERERSIDSSRSEDEEHVRGDVLTAAPSTDDTPIPSAVVSPASSMSGSENGVSAKQQKLSVGLVPSETEAQEGAEELEDVDIDEEDAQEVHSHIGGYVRRRIGGRKRAPHPDPKVEAAMRRQAHLKTAFRHLGKALRPLLDEIAERTLKQLDAENSHMEATEYSTVQQGLDDTLARKKKQIQAQNDLDLQLWDAVLVREQDIQRTKARQQFDESQDFALTALEREIAELERAANVANGDAGYETESEDSIVPRNKHAFYRYKRGGALDGRYDSRSRVMIHTKHVIGDVQLRSEMGRMLRAFDSSEFTRKREAFTAMDSTPRSAALGRRDAILRINTLAQAAAHVEYVAGIPVIRNEDAFGLNVLGDLATRPSISFVVPIKQHRQSIPWQIPLQQYQAPDAPHSRYQPTATLLSPGFPRGSRELLDRSLPPSLMPREMGAYPAGPQPFAFSPPFRVPEHRPFAEPGTFKGVPAMASRTDPAPTNFGGFRSYHAEPDWQERSSRIERDPRGPNQAYQPWSSEYQGHYDTEDRRGSALQERMPLSFPDESAKLPRIQMGIPYGGFRDFGPTEVETEPRAPIRPGPGPTRLGLGHPSAPHSVFIEEDRYMRPPPAYQGSPPAHHKHAIEPARSPRSRHSSISQQTPDWREPNEMIEVGIRGKSSSKLNKTDRAGQPRRRRRNQDREREKTVPGRAPIAAGPASLPIARKHRASLSGPPAEYYPPMQQQWQSRPEHQPASRPAQSPMMAYALPDAYGPAPAANHFRPTQYEQAQAYDQSQAPSHRASLSGLHSAPSQWHNNSSSSTHHQAPPRALPSPLYAIPQGPPPPPTQASQQPPPPGVHPDSYRTQIPAAPPPRLQYGQPLLPGSQAPPPPQFGGPTIAPARNDQRFQFAGNFAPPPAFAQQEEHQRQQYQNSGESTRRRTHSDGQRPMKVIHHHPARN